MLSAVCVQAAAQILLTGFHLHTLCTYPQCHMLYFFKAGAEIYDESCPFCLAWDAAASLSVQSRGDRVGVQPTITKIVWTTNFLLYSFICSCLINEYFTAVVSHISPYVVAQLLLESLISSLQSNTQTGRSAPTHCTAQDTVNPRYWAIDALHFSSLKCALCAILILTLHWSSLIPSW